MSWWAWMVAGLALAALEVVVPAWAFLGFALGAAAVGLLLLAGGPLAGAMAGSLALEVAAFAGLSLAGWAGLRAAFGASAGEAKRIERDVNEN